jgi:hypothetical protein
MFAVSLLSTCPDWLGTRRLLKSLNRELRLNLLLSAFFSLFLIGFGNHALSHWNFGPKGNSA